MTQDLPLVSLVTPSFNQGRYLEATIRSVLEQDYPRIQYIVQDAGSTDQTRDVLERYRDRLTAVVEPDAGQADAICRGLARSSGSILGWLNSDDLLCPGAVRQAVEAFAKHPKCPLLYGNAGFIDPAGRPIGPCMHIEPFSRHRLVHYSDFIVQPAAFFRRDAYDAAGGIDPSLHFAMDYDLWLKLTSRADAVHLPLEMAWYRWFGGNKSALGGMKRIDEVDEVARRHGARGLPAYFVLERANLRGAGVVSTYRRQGLLPAAGSAARAAGEVLSSPRAVASLMSPRVWRVIRMGRRLRRVSEGQTDVGA